MLGRFRLEADHLDYDFDMFVHVWSQDLGAKKRVEEDKLDSERIRGEFPFIKALIVEKPFRDEDFTYFNLDQFEVGQSNPAAIMGMFIGLSRLRSCVENSPLKYTHVLRLRTDMVIFDDNFFRNLKNYFSSGKIHTSRNYLIPYSWVSDHIILAPTKYFFNLWPDVNNKFYENYKRNGLNPERFLAFQAKSFKSKLKPTFMRYSDYHILYSQQNKNDPSWVNKIKKENIENVFLEPKNYLTKADHVEIDTIIHRQKQNQDYYALPKIKKLFMKFLNG